METREANSGVVDLTPDQLDEVSGGLAPLAYVAIGVCAFAWGLVVHEALD